MSSIGFVLLIGGAGNDRTLAGSSCQPVGVEPSGVSASVSGIPPGAVDGYAGVQLENAALIVHAGAELGLDSYTQQLGVMTAMAESQLVDLDHGDAAGPSSRGLFQQQDNGAWGTLADRMNPTIAATNFFNALVKVPGYETLPPTLAAHDTQANSDPFYYQPYWSPAGDVVAALAGVTVTLTDPTAAAAAPASSAAASSGSVAAAVTAPAATGTATITVTGGLRTDDPSTGDVAATISTAAPALRTAPVNVDPAAARLVAVLSTARGRKARPSTTPAGRRTPAAPSRPSATASAVPAVGPTAAPTAGLTSAPTGSPSSSSPASAGSPSLTPSATTSATASPTSGGGGTPCGTNPTTGPVSVSAGGWTDPLPGAVIAQPFGGPGGHPGIDLDLPAGTPELAAHAGTVVFAGPAQGYGDHYICIDTHVPAGVPTVSEAVTPTIVVCYGHAETQLVNVGDTVTAGEPVSLEGCEGECTGPHLHFEVRTGLWGPVQDPYAFMAAVGVGLGNGAAPTEFPGGPVITVAPVPSTTAPTSVPPTGAIPGTTAAATATGRPSPTGRGSATPRRTAPTTVPATPARRRKP